MANEFDTPADAGTEDVQTSEHDTPESPYDYFDPDEDTEEVEAAEGTDDEEGEPEDTPEDEEPEDEPEETTAAEASPDAIVRLADGTETTVAELTKGYLRQSDYTRKAQDVAQRRKAVEADAQRAEQVTQKLIDHLANFIPDEPPAQLAQTNPVQYQAQMAQYQATVRQLEQLISVRDASKAVQNQLTRQQLQDIAAEENRKLAEVFPETALQDKRQEFFGRVAETAKALNFTDDELNSQMDHRVFVLLDWARKGMEADKAKATAKAKLATASKTPSRKAGNSARNTNRDAMKRLAKTGSLKDALKVDFDF